MWELKLARYAFWNLSSTELQIEYVYFFFNVVILLYLDVTHNTVRTPAVQILGAAGGEEGHANQFTVGYEDWEKLQRQPMQKQRNKSYTCYDHDQSWPIITFLTAAYRPIRGCRIGNLKQTEQNEVNKYDGKNVNK